MQYIIPTLNSRGTPYVSPLRMSHGVSAVRSCSDAIHWSDFELTWDTSCIALADEPWGVCCEGPVVMEYINPTLNSQGTSHVSPLRMSHGVSVVGVLLRCNTLSRLWTHKGHRMYRPYGWATGCLLWGSCSDAIHYSDFELTRDTTCIALTDEPWGVCCEGPVVMQFIIPTLNSQGTSHVSPLRMNHWVSVVRTL